MICKTYYLYSYKTLTNMELWNNAMNYNASYKLIYLFLLIFPIAHSLWYFTETRIALFKRLIHNHQYHVHCKTRIPQWALSTMMSKSKNGGNSWGTLYGRPMKGLAFRYDRHEEITRYIWMRNMHYHTMVMHVFVYFKNFRLVLLFQMPYSKI